VFKLLVEGVIVGKVETLHQTMLPTVYSGLVVVALLTMQQPVTQTTLHSVPKTYLETVEPGEESLVFQELFVTQETQPLV
jgi:hypothetical protein